MFHPMEFDPASIVSFILGLIGAILCVGAYIAINFPNKVGRLAMTQNDIRYHVMNTVGMTVMCFTVVLLTLSVSGSQL